VLFDINRQVDAEEILRNDPKTVFTPLLKKVERGFDLTLVTNENEQSHRVIARRTVDGKEDASRSSTSTRRAI